MAVINIAVSQYHEMELDINQQTALDSPIFISTV